MALTITLATMDKEILRTHDLQFCTRPHPTSTTEVILQLLKDLAKWHLHPTMSIEERQEKYGHSSS